MVLSSSYISETVPSGSTQVPNGAESINTCCTPIVICTTI